MAIEQSRLWLDTIATVDHRAAPGGRGSSEDPLSALFNRFRRGLADDERPGFPEGKRDGEGAFARVVPTWPGGQ
jgi:hypothetical protein